MSGQCDTCPFGHSEAAENAINLGCVPSIGEIMQFKQQGFNWGCHSAEEAEFRPCAGFTQYCRGKGVDYKAGEHLSYEQWYREGVPVR